MKLNQAIQKNSIQFERGVQEVIWNMADVDIHSGKLDHHIGQVLIVIARILVTRSKPEPLFSDLDDLINVYELVKKLDPHSEDFWAPELRFTDQDFRNILRKPKMPSKDIERQVSKLPTLIFKVQRHASIMVVDEEGKIHWKKYEFTNYDNIAGVEVIKSGVQKRGRGAGEESRAYRIYFKSRIGLAFWHNMAAGGFSLLTNVNNRIRRFLALPGSAQMLVWAVWGWGDNKEAIRSRDQLFKIMGWKKSQNQYKRQTRQLGQYLERLVKQGFIKCWRIDPVSNAYRLTKALSVKTDF